MGARSSSARPASRSGGPSGWTGPATTDLAGCSLAEAVAPSLVQLPGPAPLERGRNGGISSWSYAGDSMWRGRSDAAGTREREEDWTATYFAVGFPLLGDDDGALLKAPGLGR